MIPIKNSALATYVEELSDADLQGVEMLTSTEAAECWAENFSRTAKGLYDLPDDSWVVRYPWVVVGEWIDAYNSSGGDAAVEEFLRNASGWPIDEPLLFAQNSRQIVVLEFGGFLRCWKDLLAAFDDGPILMSRRNGMVRAFRFVPLGHIIFTNGS